MILWLSKNLIQLITVIVATFGLIVTIINNKSIKKINSNSIYVNAITTERVRWLSNLKGLVSEFLMEIETYVPIPNQKIDIADKNEKLLLLRHKIEFHLNPIEDEKFARDIANFINFARDRYKEIIKTDDYEVKSDEFLQKHGEITAYSAALFKTEWERVKNESEGKKINKEKLTINKKTLYYKIMKMK